MEKITAKELYAPRYDAPVPDWDGAIDFYQELIRHSPLTAQGVLEAACGTGRVVLRLAKNKVV